MQIRLFLSALLGLILLASFSVSSYAYNWALESYGGIPTLSSAFKSGSWSQVNSSWNEPRTLSNGGTHKGTDHAAGYNTELTPMYSSGTVKGCGTYTDGTQYQYIKYTNGNTTYYTTYLHLSGCVKTSGAVYAGDLVAYTGDSGSSGSPHLHFEINSQDPSSGNRISVNPHDYVTDWRQKQRPVFKDWGASYVNSNYRTVYITATDFDLGFTTILNYVQLYYKPTYSSTWNGPYAMTSDGTGGFTATIWGSPGTTYDVIIAGRRNQNEYWVTYPARKTTETGTGSTVPLDSTYITKQISY